VDLARASDGLTAEAAARLGGHRAVAKLLARARTARWFRAFFVPRHCAPAYTC
jgi:hypothetical protein